MISISAIPIFFNVIIYDVQKKLAQTKQSNDSSFLIIFCFRKKSKAAGQFKNIVKAAKSGALKGAKAKRNKMK